MEECTRCIKEKKESRHFKTLERQKSKFERLCQKNGKREGGCSNVQHGEHDHTCINNRSEIIRETIQIEATGESTSNNNNNNIWVRNILSTTLD